MDKLTAQLNLWLWRLTAAEAIVELGMLGIFWKHIPPKVPLLYTLPWGQAQLVRPYFLWLIPLFASILGILTALLAERFLKDKLLLSMFFGTVIIAQLILCLGLIRIIIIIA